MKRSGWLKLAKGASALSAVSMTAALVLMEQPAEARKAGVALSSLNGDWSGTGWGTRYPGASKERLRCRLKARYQHRKGGRSAAGKNKSAMLKLSGRCAATSRSFNIAGHISEQSGSRKITGRINNPDGIGAINVAGYRDGNKLVFNYKAKDKKTKKTRKYQSVWTIGKTKISYKTTLREPGKKVVGAVTFAR